MAFFFFDTQYFSLLQVNFQEKLKKFGVTRLIAEGTGPYW